MNVGILGTGDVGRTLGGGFIGLGYEVKMGSRKPGRKKVKDWVSQNGPRASAGTYAEAAAFAELAVLAVPWSGAKNSIKLAGPKNLAGKIVIDVTNPLVFPSHAPPGFALGHTDSAGERIQRWLPEGRVVKAFNIIGYDHFVNPQFPCGPPDMFICENDGRAKKKVTQILKSFGWPTIDIGGIEGARFIEPLTMLWIIYGNLSGSWNHAFKLLRK